MLADLGIELPEFAVLHEILHQQLNWQAALDLELAVDAGFRFLQHFLRQVGPRRSRCASPPAAGPASFRHIAIEYGSCPVEEAAHQMRKDRGGAARACISAGMTASSNDRTESCRGRKTSRWWSWPTSTSAVQRVRRRSSSSETSSENSRQARLARQRHQPTFDQILLVRRQIQPGALFQKLTQRDS